LPFFENFFPRHVGDATAPAHSNVGDVAFGARRWSVFASIVTVQRVTIPAADRGSRTPPEPEKP
jgi:hypothetical protein